MPAHTRAHTQTHTQAHTHTRADIHRLSLARARTHTHTHTRALTHTDTCRLLHMQTHTRAFTHTYTHGLSLTHIHTGPAPPPPPPPPTHTWALPRLHTRPRAPVEVAEGCEVAGLVDEWPGPSWGAGPGAPARWGVCGGAWELPGRVGQLGLRGPAAGAARGLCRLPALHSCPAQSVRAVGACQPHL